MMNKQTRKPRNIMPRLSGELWSRLTDTLTVPPGWDIYVTHSNKGYARSNSKTCTVPVWAYTMAAAEKNIHKDDPRYALYYLAHELAHAWAYVNGGNIRLHGPAFYTEFKRLCPPQLWHYELGYKSRDAKRAGIDPNPLVNLRQGAPIEDRLAALPDAPTAVRQMTDRAIATTPTVSVRQLRADAIKTDPRIKVRLAQLPDHEVKSYIVGWFKESSKA